MKAKLEYRAVVAVDVDLESGEVESVTVRAATDHDERVDLSVRIDSDEEPPDEVYDRGHQIVDAAAPFELSGWSAAGPRTRSRVPRMTPHDQQSRPPSCSSLS